MIYNHAPSSPEGGPVGTLTRTVPTGPTLSLLLGVSRKERSYREKYIILRSLLPEGGPVGTPLNVSPGAVPTLSHPASHLVLQTPQITPRRPGLACHACHLVGVV